MTVAELIVRIGAETTGLQRGLKQAQAQLVGFKRIGNGLASVGSAMSKYVTLPILVAGAASAKFAIDFQRQMEMVHTQAGASQTEVVRLSKAVLALAGNTVQGPVTLAQGLYHVESVGLRGAKAMSVLKIASQGAQLGFADLEDTASALAAAVVTGIKGTENYGKAMGSLNAIVGAGNMRMQDLVSALGNVLPTGKNFGLTLDSVGSALAFLTDRGMSAAQASTRLRMTISMMGAPTKKAAGILQSLGLNSSALAIAMRGPKGILGALELLHQHMQNLSQVKQAQVLAGLFGGGRSSTAAMALMGRLDILRQKFAQVQHGGAKFASDVAASNQTAAVKLQKAWSQIEVALIRAGAVIAPVFALIASKVAGLADAFSRLSPSAQRWVVVCLAIVAVVGPLLFMLGKMIVLGYQVATVLMAIDGAALPWIALAAAIVAVVVLLVVAYEKVGWFHHAVNVAFHSIEAVVRVVVDFIKRYWKQALAVMLAPFLVFIGLIINYWNGIKAVAETVFGWIGGHWKALVATFIPVLGPVIVAIVSHWNTVKNVAESAWGAIRTAIGWVVGALQSVVAWIGRIHWPSPPGWLKSIAGGIGGGISSAYHTGLTVSGLGATGGIVTQATRAIIGEAGPEAVVPLNRMPGAHPLGSGGGGGGGLVINVNGPIIGAGNTSQLARELARLIKPHLDRAAPSITIG